MLPSERYLIENLPRRTLIADISWLRRALGDPRYDIKAFEHFRACLNKYLSELTRRPKPLYQEIAELPVESEGGET